LTTWIVIVPLSLAALLTGVVQSLGTPWGLFRHRWIVAKLALTVVATVLLLVHTQPIGRSRPSRPSACYRAPIYVSCAFSSSPMPARQ
jgi:hypothetical protein